MNVHPLFNPGIKWLTPQELGEKRIKELVDEKCKDFNTEPKSEPDYTIKPKRKTPSKYAR